ncbi:MAG: NADP-dependent phosphogluconate dehydrogenase [Pseudomonadota bacterium]
MSVSTNRTSVGLVGLGTMGAALALNIADNGYPIAVYNRTGSVTGEFVAQAGVLADKITPTKTLEEFVAAIASPRSIILMVPAGPIVDAQIEALRPLLNDDDLIIDAGNAQFDDTNRRAAHAVEAGVPYLGIGVSGGEEGARFGPSIMGGGDAAAWERVRPMMEAISAKHDIVPCATHMGPAGAGHYVKMVHNGIEYADMQMIAEVYGMLRDGHGLEPTAIGDVFSKWNEGPLKSYLIEISAAVARAVDPDTGNPMLDIILDSAGQKGTGRWTAIEALKQASPVTAIDAAVAARNFSSRVEERAAGEAIFGPAPTAISTDVLSVDQMEQALLAGKIACYAQGFSMLATAAEAYGWAIPMPEVAKVWRAGCIIRSAMLDDMADALADHPDVNLMFAPHFSALMKENHAGLRSTIAGAAVHGHAVPALGAALAYFDAMRTARGTANMIQGQRDFFGAHGFKRLDKTGDHHGPWGMG